MERESICMEFGSHIRAFRKRMGEKQKRTFSQEQLCNYLKTHSGWKEIEKWATQKTISRIERGENVMLPETLVRKFQELCEIPEDIVEKYIALSEKKEIVQGSDPSLISISEDGHLLTHASHEEFYGYFGRYHCYFHSTNSDDPRLIEGVFYIENGNGASLNCVARLEIIENGAVIKNYRGQFLLNNHFRSSYCILIGDEKQEVCMLIGSHFNITKGKNLLNVALVLTTSAGSQKRPTMHRMLFCRKELSSKQKSDIHALLKLNTDKISISESRLNELEAEVKTKLGRLRRESSREKMRAILDCIEHIKENADREVYYKIDESIIYDSGMFSDDVKTRSLIVSALREYSGALFYNKVSNTVEEICKNLVGEHKE